MYRQARGVSGNFTEALKWYGLAAEQGFVSAQNTLGIMYVTGTGVPQNYVEAYKWWVIAASEGVQEPADNRDRVRAYMTPAQIAEAEKLAAEWKPKK